MTSIWRGVKLDGQRFHEALCLVESVDPWLRQYNADVKVWYVSEESDKLGKGIDSGLLTLTGHSIGFFPMVDDPCPSCGDFGLCQDGDEVFCDECGVVELGA